MVFSIRSRNSNPKCKDLNRPFLQYKQRLIWKQHKKWSKQQIGSLLPASERVVGSFESAGHMFEMSI